MCKSRPISISRVSYKQTAAEMKASEIRNHSSQINAKVQVANTCLIVIPGESIPIFQGYSGLNLVLPLESHVTVVYSVTVSMVLDPFLCSLLAGSAAGTSVDVTLFPLDTLKTRLQSAKGFWASGGFSGIYRGLGPAFVGSAPNAAVFFCTYDSSKAWINSQLLKNNQQTNTAWVHMLAASLGETVSCFIRVPVEILKQRRQVGSVGTTKQIISAVLREEGPRGFYRGYLSTLFREIPFSLIQFPLWEYLKSEVALRNSRKGSIEDEVVNPLCTCTPFQSSLCGAVAGGFSAALTTPLDVAKTRIMLADAKSQESRGRILPVLRLVFREKGFTGLFAGVLPRTLWISLGGSIFFGTYELVKSIVSPQDNS